MSSAPSTLLFSPTKNGYVNLTKEGFSEFTKAPFTADNPKIYHCGDVMYDNAIYFSQRTVGMYIVSSARTEGHSWPMKIVEVSEAGLNKTLWVKFK